jgi:hypothetical protein
MRWGTRIAVTLVAVLVACPAVALAEGPDYNPQPPPDSTTANPFEAIPPPADSAPPDTHLERSILQATTRSIRFWFSASEPVQGFLCKLDKGDYKPCGSPRTYKHLKQGRHTFRVKAVDLAGNVDGSPAIAHFRVPKPYRGRR